MSPLPPLETSSLERELNFMKQTISSLRDQLDHSLELHELEIQSLEKEFKNKEINLQKVIGKLREDYEQLS